MKFSVEIKQLFVDSCVFMIHQNKEYIFLPAFLCRQFAASVDVILESCEQT